MSRGASPEFRHVLNASGTPHVEAGQVQAYVPAAESRQDANVEGSTPAVYSPLLPAGMDTLGPGRRVTVSIGHEIVNGTIDVVMSDNSGFWILSDGGMGRRLIDLKVARINPRSDQPLRPFGNELPLLDQEITCR